MTLIRALGCFLLDVFYGVLFIAVLLAIGGVISTYCEWILVVGFILFIVGMVYMRIADHYHRIAKRKEKK